MKPLPKSVALAVTVLEALLACDAAAQQPLPAPGHNPFDRPPDVLAITQAQPVEVVAAPLVLRTTLTGTGPAMANIDGQILAVGDTYLGYRVIAIKEGRVTLIHNGERTVLTMHDAATDPGRR